MNNIFMGAVASQMEGLWKTILAPGEYTPGNYPLTLPLDSVGQALWVYYEDEYYTFQKHAFSVSPHSSISFNVYSRFSSYILQVILTITAYNTINIDVNNMDVPGIEERVKIYKLSALFLPEEPFTTVYDNYFGEETELLNINFSTYTEVKITVTNGEYGGDPINFTHIFTAPGIYSEYGNDFIELILYDNHLWVYSYCEYDVGNLKVEVR